MADTLVKIMAALNDIASVAYFYQGDIPRGFYWLGGAVLVAATRYMK